MTSDGLPSGHDLSAWHRRFPDRRLWAGRLRLWRVELAIASNSTPSLLGEWIARAATAGPGTAARRLGLPAAVVLAHGERMTRRAFAFLDLPTGRRPVAPPAITFDRWPEPIEEVPAEVLRPEGVEVIPPTADWRTVPVVWVEAADVVAVWVGDGIQVFAVDSPESEPLWELSADALRVT